ncbi:MAG TPA: hypothetical protein VGB82_14355 [Alphaproteobacteria bacterium]
MDDDKQQKPPPPNVADRLDLAAKRAMQDAEYRKQRAGSSGAASDVRRIDPKDYVPAPTSKPGKSKPKSYR